MKITTVNGEVLELSMGDVSSIGNTKYKGKTTYWMYLGTKMRINITKESFDKLMKG